MTFEIPLTPEPHGDGEPEILMVSMLGDREAMSLIPTVGVWTVPRGVRSLTVYAFGAAGGFSLPPDMMGPFGDRGPIGHSVNVPVTPGQECRFAAGGPPWAENVMEATTGNGPLRGGDGATNQLGDNGGAGGGASTLHIDDELIILSAGGGGWIDSTGPTNGWPTGGDEGLAGNGQDGDRGGLGSPDVSAGSGAGAPPGTAVLPPLLLNPGENGTSILPVADSGGPRSPQWSSEIVTPADFYVNAYSIVRVYYYPGRGGWRLGLGW